MTLVNTQYFSEAANYKLKNGLYTTAPYGSKEYHEYWAEEDKRCLEGYKVGGVRITGQHYFFLNYKQLESVRDVKAISSEKTRTFPRFWEAHYKFFLALEQAEIAGKHMCILKPRGSGFSEIMSSIGVYHYTLIKGSKCFYFASNEGYLNKDGVITKCWDHLEFLNAETSKAYRHLRQKKDQDLHKRASMIDPKTGNEYGYKSEIIGRVIDHPRKVRGARTGSRGKVFFEEGGSFPNLKDAVITTRPLVEQGGITTGQIIVWGCLTKGQKVWTKDGILVSIEDIQQESGIIGYHESGVPSVEHIEYIQEPKTKPCYKITTHTGRTLECSDDHPILWSNAKYGENKKIELLKVNGKRKRTSGWIKKFKYKETKDIQIGDHVGILESLPIFGSKSMWHPRTVGWLVGDGSYGFNKSPVLSNCDNEINYLLANTYETKITREFLTKTGKEFRETRIKGICQSLRDLGIYGQTGLNKTLPYNVDQYTKEDICEMLGGIFDTDGCVHYTAGNNYIDLTSSSASLLNEIRFLLQKLSIHCNIQEIKCNPGPNSLDKNNWFVLYISDGRSIQAFHKEIKFKIKYKQDRLEIIANYKLGRKQKISKSLGDKGIRFEIVKSVEYIGEQPVYNLTASNTHTYVANGIITHNTGGERGPGIEGLEHIFYHPDAYNMMAWQNNWDEDRVGTKCCYFIPVYDAMDKYMDEEGNSMTDSARDFHVKERKRIHVEDSSAEDKYIAEFPFTPSEALIRLSNNIFPVVELQKQLLKVTTDRNIQGFLKHGWMVKDTNNKAKFRLDKSAKPILTFPHGSGDNLQGCVTIVESPHRDQAGIVPHGLYVIVVDPYYKDDSEDKTSLASAYIYKHFNNVSPTEDDIIVAWYCSRPEKLDDFYRQLFLLAEYYNATIQAEIAGGGKGILDYATFHKLKQYCEKEPDIVYNKEGTMKSYNKPYFMNMPAERKQLALAYLSDWLKTERSAYNDEGEVTMIMNLHKIYDEALLKELIKFNALEGNFDRVSAMRLLPFMIKERSNYEYKTRQESSALSFWDREMHTSFVHQASELQMSPWDLMNSVKEELEPELSSKDITKEKTSYTNTIIYPEDLG